jgi:Na+/melibiose symporter-like transporter
MIAVAGSFKPVRDGPPTRMHTDIAEGLRYLWGHGLLRTFALMVGVMNLTSGAAFAVFVLYAVAPGPMGLSEPQFGLLLTTTAVGGVLGTLAAPRLIKRYGRARLLIVAILWAFFSGAVVAVSEHEASSQKSAARWAASFIVASLVGAYFLWRLL